MHVKILSFWMVLLWSGITWSQTDRKVIVLDMTQRNSETNLSRWQGTLQMMDLIGVPYDTTSDLNVAFDYPVLVTGSRIVDGAFTNSELTDLQNWVNAGGVLITSNLREPDLEPMAGIDTTISDDELYQITWDTAGRKELFRQVDDSLEVTVSLGRPSSGPTFYSRYFTLTSGVGLGFYENGFPALVKNDFGSGHMYTLGPDFRDVIYRPRINMDVNAHRTYSNGFEPSSDVFAFIVRNIIMLHIPNAVYKYPVPGNYSSLLCVTHDIDSRTAIDTMYQFIDAEVARGFKAQYNLTVRYKGDAWMTAFYLGAGPQIEYAKLKGHTLASHSVGHFPDFADETVFPFGNTGNDTSNYQPVYFSGMTIGGTVMGEVEVSKNLIEYDFGVPVKSWRSGHLAFPDSLVVALEMMGYEYNSTYSSNDILTNFPYYAADVQSFSGMKSSVLEIPMTISDVFASDPITELNYMQKVGVWSDVNRRYDRNNSSLVLLIHPNRGWKLNAQEAFLDSLNNQQGVWAFEEYGQFWKERDVLDFHSALDLVDPILTVTMENVLGNDQSFVLDTTGIELVYFLDNNGDTLSFASMPFDGSLKLFYRSDFIGVGMTEIEKSQEHVRIYPNPGTDRINFRANHGIGIHQIQLWSLEGRLITAQKVPKSQSAMIDVSAANLANGVYVLVIETDKGVFQQKWSKMPCD